MTRSKKTQWSGSRKHPDPFWNWFWEVNPDISQRDFVKELARGNNPGIALERLFAKMNSSAANKRSVGKSEGED